MNDPAPTTLLQWQAEHPGPKLRMLDYLAFQALGTSEAADVEEVVALVGALTRPDQVAWCRDLANRGHIGLAVRVAELLPERSRPLVMFLARGLLYLQRPQQCLDLLAALPDSDQVRRLRVRALLDLEEGSQAIAEAHGAPEIERQQLLDYVQLRERAAAWRPSGSPTRIPQVVSLPQDIYRRWAISRRLEQLGSPFAFVRAETSTAVRELRMPEVRDAVWRDRASWTLRERTIPDPTLEPPADGDFGNQVTQYRIWRAGIGCVVLEDDAYPLAADFAEIADQAERAGADLVLFTEATAGAGGNGPFSTLAEGIAAHCRRNPDSGWIGGHGYALSARGAATFVDMMKATGFAQPGLDFMIVAASLTEAEIQALPTSVIREQLLARRARMQSAIALPPLAGLASNTALVEARPFGASRQTR